MKEQPVEMALFGIVMAVIAVSASGWSSLSAAAESSPFEGIFFDRRIYRLNEARPHLENMSVVQTIHLTTVSHTYFSIARMGKLRAKRRAADRRDLDGQESDFENRATTSEIAGRISTIFTTSRSATSITESDNDSNNNNNISTDDDAEILAVSAEALTVADPAQQPSKKTDTDKKSKPAVPRSLPSPPPSPTMAVARAVPLLICSVGNPGSTYANTLHSAGHTVLKKLSERLEYSPYQKSRPLGSGLVSKPLAPNSDTDWTLWQSTSLMNVSGKGVKAAHHTWAQDKPAGEGRLVIVHDEMEKPLGAVNLNVRQGASAKGHNGLKSIMASIGNVPFVRIGIGIGRPVSRESKDVANYVMRKMTPGERAKIEGSVEEVIAKLKELESG
jgi:PTH1 family peptidyl-tRNA hydrolase